MSQIETDVEIQLVFDFIKDQKNRGELEVASISQREKITTHNLPSSHEDTKLDSFAAIWKYYDG